MSGTACTERVMSAVRMERERVISGMRGERSAAVWALGFSVTRHGNIY